MKNEIEIKQQVVGGILDEDDQNALNITIGCKFEVIIFINIFIKLQFSCKYVQTLITFFM